MRSEYVREILHPPTSNLANRTEIDLDIRYVTFVTCEILIQTNHRYSWLEDLDLQSSEYQTTHVFINISIGMECNTGTKTEIRWEVIIERKNGMKIRIVNKRSTFPADTSQLIQRKLTTLLVEKTSVTIISQSISNV